MDPSIAKAIMQPKRLKVKDSTSEHSPSKYQYNPKPVNEDVKEEREMSPLKKFEMNLNKKERSEYMTQMDFNLERLRNDIVNRHQSLNDKLFRLRFEAKRSKKAVDSEKRQYDSYIRDLTNKPFQAE